MRLLRVCVDHPHKVLGTYGLLLVLGLWALLRLPIHFHPTSASFEWAVVSENLPGSALEVEQRHTIPLENRLKTLPGLKHYRSHSMPGAATLLLEFESESRARLSLCQLLPLLPSEAKLLPVQPSKLPLVSWAINSPDCSLAQLRLRFESEILPRIRRLAGVESIVLGGGGGENLELWADPQAMAIEGISCLDLRSFLEVALPQQGFWKTPLGSQPLYTLPAGSQSPEEWLETIAQGQDWLRLVRVPDHQLESFRWRGQEALALHIVPSPSASSLALIDQCETILQEVRQWSVKVEWERAVDRSPLIRSLRDACSFEFALATLLAGCVLWWFLGDARATLVVLATIPASLALAFLAMACLGLSLNSSSLVGLLLAIGRVVDDTLIDVHACWVRRQQGQSLRAAVLEGCGQMRRAVLVTTLATILALIPLFFSGGLTEAMFRALGVPFLLALLGSLLVSFTLTPALLILTGGPVRRHFPMDWLETRYRQLLQGPLPSPPVLIVSLAGLIWLSLSLARGVGWEMMPQSDTAQLLVQLEAPPGASRTELNRLARNAESVFFRQSEITGAAGELGMSSSQPYYTGYSMRSMESLQWWVTLRPPGQRKRTLWEVSDRLEAALRTELGELRRLSLRELGSDLMGSAMAPVEVVLVGPSVERLSWLGEQLMRLGRTLPGLTQLSTSWSLYPESWKLRIDRAACRRSGVDPQEISEMVILAGAGRELKASNQGQSALKLRFAETAGANWERLQRLPLVGGKQKLGSFLSREPQLAVTQIDRSDGQRALSLSGSYRPGGATSMELSMELQMLGDSQLPLPPGYRLESRGDMRAMMDSSRRLAQGLGLALLIQAGLFWVSYGSLRFAGLALVSLVPGLLGAMLGLAASGQSFSTVSLLAVILLQGMASTGVVLLLDSMRGANTREMLLQAAAQRLRPLLMTALVTILVLLPLALRPALGLDAYRPLATVVIGGLGWATLFSLFLLAPFGAKGIFTAKVETPQPS